MKSVHFLQKRVSTADWLLPNNRLTMGEPIPSNGALQALQRGLSGKRLKNRRPRFSKSLAPVVRNSRQRSSLDGAWLSGFRVMGHLGTPIALRTKALVSLTYITSMNHELVQGITQFLYKTWD
jgi:hypothetical protein